MFLPYLIALFLGLVHPSDHTNCNTNTSVVSTSGAGDEGDGGGVPDDGTGGGGTGTGGTGGGSTGGGAGGGSTGGEGGQIPPPKP